MSAVRAKTNEAESADPRIKMASAPPNSKEASDFGKRVLETLDETFDHSYLQQFVRERLERRDAIAQEMLHSRGIGTGEERRF